MIIKGLGHDGDQHVENDDLPDEDGTEENQVDNDVLRVNVLMLCTNEVIFITM